MKKKSFNPFKYKVIETVYNGYRFRSRLEARWATFFDTLGIKYEYEKEGFDLEGTWYLPDFWLSERNIWVEIKGQEPTEEEQHKAEKLAHYTDKATYIISGNIPSLQDDMGIIQAFYPASLSAVQRQLDETGERVIGTSYRDIDLSKEALAVLQKLHEAHFIAQSYQKHLLFTPESVYGSEDLELYLTRLEKQRSILAEIITYVRQYEEEIASALIVEEGWEAEFREQIFVDGIEWVECSECEEITTGVSGFPHHTCSNESRLSSKTPRLIEAYTQARQARF